MEVKIIFMYEIKNFCILCNSNDEMVDILKKLISKLNPKANIEDYEYLFEGKELSTESTLAKNVNLEPYSSQKEIIISVKRRLRICKCPKCKCNDCIINLKNYQIGFYGCRYDENKKHQIIDIYDNYRNNQAIDLREIRCHEPGCEKNLQNEQYDFYKCLGCTKRVGISKYFCQEHSSKHEKHFLVKYDEKNYYCNNHFEALEKCCLTCTKDLCKSCEDEHSGHQITSYNDMTTDISKLKESLKIIRYNIDTLKEVIDDIKYNLDGTLRIYNRYYNIANDIIKKYETFNKKLKNYRILRTVRNLKFSNNQIKDDLNKFIKEKDLSKKCLMIIETYLQKEHLYKGMNSNDIEKENDENWYQEILKEKIMKKEKQKEQEKESKKKQNVNKKK